MEPRHSIRTPKFLWLLLLLPVLALACRSVIPSDSQIKIPTLPNQQSSEQPAGEVQAATPNPQPVTLPASVTDEQSLLIDLYTRVNPSVVNVTIYTTQNGDLVPLGQGSGFVFDTQGHIVTNAHVVHGADYVEVTFSDDTVRKAEVTGQDLNADLAVVKVDSLPSGAAPLPLADFKSLSVGQTVIAIGNPFGLSGSLSRGIISALGRTIPALTQFSIPMAVQTDAAINPGNSGGPLLNLKGEVIGVNAQIETNGTSNSNSGVGFAIPVNLVQRVVPELIKNGKFDWAWLGVRGGSLYPQLVEAMKLPVEKGAYLAEVVSGGPADKAGLRGASRQSRIDNRVVDTGGDVVIAIDGQPVNSFDDLLIYVSLQGSPGKEVTLTIVRDGQQKDVKLTLEPRPESVDQPTNIQP